MRASLALYALVISIAQAAPLPTPPNIPTAATAKTQLAALTVAAQGSQGDTRETVLKRDGTGIVQSAACAATSGTWASPYDGATWTASSDVDIDHMVPLSNAWKSGAASWTTARRQAFANDLTNPQLVAVTDNVNSAKGDKGPEEWKPPLTSYYLAGYFYARDNLGRTYARMWVKVKSVYSLTITAAEKTALTSMLATC